jgi:NADPH:quinone reductase-like Zn-dependent oxidoreductase
MAGNEEKVQYCRSLGADVVINYKEEDFVKRVKEETGGEGSKCSYLQEAMVLKGICGESANVTYFSGVNVILDNIGASYLQRNLDALSFDGRLFIIGFQGGAKADLNLGPILGKRLTIQGTILMADYMCVIK